MRKELKRGLIAVVLLACIGAATFITVAASAGLRGATKSALASRLRQAR